LTNNSILRGFGTLGGSGGIMNTGVIKQENGTLVLANTGTNVNSGGAEIHLEEGRLLQLSGNGFYNSGFVRLNGATISGTGQIVNNPEGTIVGHGTINSNINSNGTIIIDDGMLKINPSFTNVGIVELTSDTAQLSSPNFLTNVSGATIQGHGKITASIINHGTIEAIGGTLNIINPVTKNAGSTIAVTSGNKILFTGNAGANNGTISMAGGTIEFGGGNGLTNGTGGMIVGYGTFRTNSLNNNALISFSGGSTMLNAPTSNSGTLSVSGAQMTVTGALTNTSGGKIIVTGNSTATFNSALALNSGSEFRITAGSSAIFLGNVTGSGTFTSSGTKYFEAGNSVITNLVSPGSTVVDGAAKLTAAKVNEKSLTVAGRMTVNTVASGGSTMRLDTLSMVPGGVLDLNDNDIIVEHGNYQQISDARWQGYRDSTDTTAVGIISTVGQTLVGHPILAVLDNALLGTSDWPFGSGQTVGSSAVLGQFAYLGDADLNGMVTPDDYLAVDSNLGKTVSMAGGMNWFAGDWNFDGQVTPDDYIAIDANLGLGASNPLSANGLAAVPEPVGMGLAMVSLAGGMLSRRGRRGR
ncbi:MAG TPA: hypothetical protein VF669_20845, partial [Tepidisphaeraceae bacterium]